MCENRDKARFVKGMRVELHAACNEWMQGDRYGNVKGFGRVRDCVCGEKFRPVLVVLDSGRVRRFHPDNLFVVGE